MSEEWLPTVAKARIWDKSGLIEDARVPDQSLFQTEEFDRDNPGNLENYELVQRKAVRATWLSGRHKLHKAIAASEDDEVISRIKDAVKELDAKLDVEQEDAEGDDE